VGQIDEGISMGAKAGFGVGITVGVILIGVAVWLIVRNKRKPVKVQDAEKRGPSPVELHDDGAQIHQLESKMVYPPLEMPATSAAPRYELGVRASTWLVELPNQSSNRNSRQRP
jgi:hypothetical protein